MTLISVHNSEGCVGRCDAKCYDADSPASECDCICHGMNHGAGKTRATDNTRLYADEMIKKYIKEKNIENGKGETNQEIFQLNLF